MAERKQERTIPVLNVYPIDESVTDFILESEEVQKFIYEHTPAGISDALSKRKTTAQLFRVNNTEEYVELSKDQWVSAIDSCIKYYEKQEKFEKCANLTTLRSKIKTRKSPKLKI
jgi:hypothetical protein